MKLFVQQEKESGLKNGKKMNFFIKNRRGEKIKMDNNIQYFFIDQSKKNKLEKIASKADIECSISEGRPFIIEKNQLCLLIHCNSNEESKALQNKLKESEVEIIPDDGRRSHQDPHSIRIPCN